MSSRRNSLAGAVGRTPPGPSTASRSSTTSAGRSRDGSTAASCGQSHENATRATVLALAEALGVDCTAFSQEATPRESPRLGRRRKAGADSDQAGAKKPKKSRKRPG